MLGADSDTLGDFLYKQREGRSEGCCSGEVVLCGWIRAGLIIAIFLGLIWLAEKVNPLVVYA